MLPVHIGVYIDSEKQDKTFAGTLYLESNCAKVEFFRKKRIVAVQFRGGGFNLVIENQACGRRRSHLNLTR